MVKKSFPIIDIGLVWAKVVNIWGQLGTAAGIVNFIMMLGVFYTTTVYPNVKMPLWIYLSIVIIGAIIGIGFILKWGISGYYRFLSKQSELSEVNNKLTFIMKEMKITEKYNNEHKK
jgi:hypothetical protein